MKGGVTVRLVSGEVSVRFTQGGALGDVILQLGAACYYARNRFPVRIVCNTYCFNSVEDMLMCESDVEPIDTLNEDKSHQDWPKMVDLNDPKALLQTLQGHPLNWYKQWRVPFSARWTHCPIPEVVKDIVPSHEEVIFVHDDPVRDQVINVEGYRPPMTDSILDHVPVLKAAKEIHCMDSCFFHLVESMPRVKAKLFFHAYVRPITYWPELPMRHDWEIIT